MDATTKDPDARELFEDELKRRGVDFSIDPESGRHNLRLGGGTSLVSLENLQREFARDGDEGRVSRFIDSILSEETFSAENLYWCLEPNDYEERPEFRVELSDRVDRVLEHFDARGGCLTWVNGQILRALGMTLSEAKDHAFSNLARALSTATIEANEIDGVKLGMIGTNVPFKASLILAPNLRSIVGDKLGWPLKAVAPVRDFLYLWASEHTEFQNRLGEVVVREFFNSPYSLSTEVWEITDNEVWASGEYPTATNK